ncbi:MAG: hypothetical protein ACYS6Z_12055, partial [Planctomycetota bacterium]
MKKPVVLAALLALLLGHAARADTPSMTQSVAAVILERMQAKGFTVTTLFKRSRSGLRAGFRLGEGGWRDAPTYRSENRSWKTTGTRRAPRHTASVSIFLKSHDPTKPPKGFEDQARPARKLSRSFTRLGKDGKLETERVEYTETKAYSKSRQAGATVERLIYTRSCPAMRLVGWAPSALTEPAGKNPPAVRTRILYRYSVTRSDQRVPRLLEASITVRNGNGWVVEQAVNYSDIENVVFWAIAEAERRAREADKPDKRETDQPGSGDEQDTAEKKPDSTGDDTVSGDETTPDPPKPDKPDRTGGGKPGGAYADVVNVYVGMGDVQRELLYIRAQLRAGVVAMQEEREHLESVLRTLELLGEDHKDAAFYREWKEEIKKTLAALEQERDELLAKSGKQWHELRKNLDAVINARSTDASLRRELEGLRDHLALREQISVLETLLVAGKSHEFRRRLTAALRNPKLAERGLELQAIDLLEREKMAEAFYALRVAKERHPKNVTIARLMDGIESAYLRMISGKAVGDAARLRVEWNKYTAGTDRGLLWQAFFTGMKRPFHVATGKLKKLEALHNSGMDRGAMVHNGIELMFRLRRKGLSLEDIEKLDFYALREWLIKIAPERGAPSDGIVDNFSIALELAFKNEDVKRLRSSDKALMNVDPKRSYYSHEEFEERWWETGLDIVSAKNVLLIFGPFAMTKGAGMLTRFAQRMAGAAPARAALAEQATALTVQEWVYARPFMQEVAKRIAQSRAGQALNNSRHVLRALRYDSPTLVRGTTAVTGFGANMAAHWLLMEGMGHVGREIGGEYGQLAGELLAGVVGVPGTGSVGRLQQRWEKSMSALKTARAQWQVTETVLKAIRAPIHEASASLAAGRTLSATQRETLQSTAARAEEAAATARAATAKTGGSSLVNGAADEAETLAATARATAAGKVDQSVAASQASKTIAAEVQHAAKLTGQAERRMSLVMERGPRVKDLRPRPRQARPPGAPPALEGPPVPPRKSVPKLTKPPPVPPKPPPKAPAPQTVAELEARATAAMIAEEFDDAAALLRTAVRQLEEAGAASPRVTAALAEAKAAVRMKEVLSKRAALPSVQKLAAEADEAMLPFNKAQREHLGKVTKAMTEELEGAGGARLITDANGNPLAVWKPAAREGVPGLKEEGQLIAELLHHRLARKLGLRVPHAEAMKLGDEAGVVIRWIPNSTDLAKLSPGSRLALKSQIAAFRPLQIVTGNYDIHFGNFKIDRAGRVWVIDAGNSYMMTPVFP